MDKLIIIGITIALGIWAIISLWPMSKKDKESDQKILEDYLQKAINKENFRTQFGERSPQKQKESITVESLLDLQHRTEEAHNNKGKENWPTPRICGGYDIFY